MPKLPPLPEDPLVGEVLEFVEHSHLARRYRELDARPEFPRSEFRAMGGAGLLGLRTSRDLGGRGLSLPRTGVLLFHLARAAGTTFAKLALQPEFCSVLADQGSPDLVDAWFRPLLRGDRLVGNQITEPTAGSDASALEMRASRAGNHYVLDGEKTEAAFAEDADAAIVYARVAGPDARREITAFLVPQDLPGITRSRNSGDLGERWMGRGSVRYRGVELPVGSRIGEEGRGLEYVRPELTRERALLATIYLGVAWASWEETVGYVAERPAFHRTLSDHQAVAFPLVQDGARLQAAWLYAERVLTDLERGKADDAGAALSKWMATEVALETLDHAIQFHGGRGYSRDLPHEQRYRDVRSGKIAHGPSEIMLAVGARELWKKS